MALDIVLDLPPRLETEFFDDDLHRRLEKVGTLRRVDPAESRSRDPRMGAEVLVTGWGTKMLPEHREPHDRLRMVAHSAGTVRRMVPKSLIESGVVVSQAANGMATSVAELALAFTISLLRNLHTTERAMYLGYSWESGAAVPTGHTVSGSPIGVIGASRVGQAYIRLVRSAGAEVQVYDPYLSPATAAALGVTLAPLDELLASSRVVAVHAPVTPETRRMLDARRLGLIADGSVLINTARSAVIDTDALISELATGRISAGLDVFDEEPLPPSSPLWGMPNVILTPHLGGITLDAQRAQGTIVVEEIERFAHGEPLQASIPADRYDILA